VVTSSGTSSRSVADRFGFTFAAASATDVIADDGTETVFIATRHDTHASYVADALEAGRNVFVEKPLCLSSEELERIVTAWKRHRPLLMVGFNRRFSPHAKEIKAALGDGPMSMIYRVNAGAIPADSWIQDADIGGGRIIGELCHFIDFLIFMSGSLPTKIQAFSLPDPSQLVDTVSVNLMFGNGSIGSISYFANGSKSLAKEYVEIYKSGSIARLWDFKRMELLTGRKPLRKKLASQDKGQRAMVESVMRSIRAGDPAPIPMAEILACTIATFRAVESIAAGDVRTVELT
jgi:polar amino acid transport system substrate-binding protein